MILDLTTKKARHIGQSAERGVVQRNDQLEKGKMLMVSPDSLLQATGNNVAK